MMKFKLKLNSRAKNGREEARKPRKESRELNQLREKTVTAREGNY